MSQLNRGRRLVEVLKQPQYQPLPVEKQVIIIYAATNGYLDRGRRSSGVRAYETELFAFLDTRTRAAAVGAGREEADRRRDQGGAEPGAQEFGKTFSGRGRRRPPDMPSLLDIRRRIRAVKSTQQITKAMKMVAASRLRRAQERIQQARPFAIADAARAQQPGGARRSGGRIRCSTSGRRRSAGGRALLFVITADRGLCGSFNTNVIKAAGTFITEQPGARGGARAGRPPRPRLFRAARLRGPLRAGQPVRAACSSTHAQAIAGAAIEAFIDGEVDSVYLVYNEFKSVMSAARRRRAAAADPAARRSTPSRAARPQPAAIDYLYEPAPEELFAHLIPAPRRGAGVPGAARVERRVLRRADDGDGRRDAQLGRDDRAA